MAQQRIRQSKLPEILAQFNTSPLAEGINAATKGITQGMDLASTLADRKRKRELQDMQIQELQRKIAEAKAKKEAQKNLIDTTGKLETLKDKGMEIPATTIPFGPEQKPATLADISLSAPRETSQFTGNLGGDTYMERPDGVTQHMRLPETEIVTKEMPTGESPFNIPSMTSDLERQVEQYKREAYPELYGKSLFKDKPTAKDTAQTDLYKAQAEAARSLAGKRDQGDPLAETKLRKDIATKARDLAIQQIGKRDKYGALPSQQAEWDTKVNELTQQFEKAILEASGLKSIIMTPEDYLKSLGVVNPTPEDVQWAKDKLQG